MYDKLTLVNLAQSRMDWIARRQEVLSENIANANTPKYIPKDLKPYNFKDVLDQSVPAVKLRATNAAHVVPEFRDEQRAVDTKKVFESSPDGNAVVLEEQMAKVGEAKTAYDVAAGLFQRQFKMLKTALGKGI
ncbi:putative flagellar basal-body rod protein FlgB [Magnetospirillum gryphiswaldense MSR-1 v2]|uniref:Flagellar basal body rod protein FlgB n=1 Tax=Magnetospirillum gryphiswaldense (strain DSM 6361 / JCM 21280 / NBRC 15271 / MSR-1) TaxID=431944 RepID=V6F3T8_MAGGM|nr:flagellar basal body rod protein FlgB [Magnetospirillum gryphiswaldense]CDL00195.1 putative flagellar basal-body rod protein FlgB [Magnetospirillum gryphiswaldense MSR-1 v2]